MSASRRVYARPGDFIRFGSNSSALVYVHRDGRHSPGEEHPPKNAVWFPASSAGDRHYPCTVPTNDVIRHGKILEPDEVPDWAWRELGEWGLG